MHRARISRPKDPGCPNGLRNRPVPDNFHHGCCRCCCFAYVCFFHLEPNFIEWCGWWIGGCKGRSVCWWVDAGVTAAYRMHGYPHMCVKPAVSIPDMFFFCREVFDRVVGWCSSFYSPRPAPIMSCRARACHLQRDAGSKASLAMTVRDVSPPAPLTWRAARSACCHARIWEAASFRRWLAGTCARTQGAAGLILRLTRRIRGSGGRRGCF